MILHVCYVIRVRKSGRFWTEPKIQTNLKRAMSRGDVVLRAGEVIMRVNEQNRPSMLRPYNFLTNF
jgi:hypothetical protein